MRLHIIVVGILVSLISLNAQARDTTLHLAIKEAMSSANFQERLDSDVKLYFGNQRYPKPITSRGDFIANKKTNSVGKSEQQACEWALLSAILSLQSRAISLGGNAVVDIVSYYKKNKYSSQTEYECHDGTFITGVALKGRVVTLP